jgi:hypothetical protein
MLMLDRVNTWSEFITDLFSGAAFVISQWTHAPTSRINPGLYLDIGFIEQGSPIARGRLAAHYGMQDAARIGLC